MKNHRVDKFAIINHRLCAGWSKSFYHLLLSAVECSIRMMKKKKQQDSAFNKTTVTFCYFVVMAKPTNLFRIEEKRGRKQKSISCTTRTQWNHTIDFIGNRGTGLYVTQNTCVQFKYLLPTLFIIAILSFKFFLFLSVFEKTVHFSIQCLHRRQLYGSIGTIINRDNQFIFHSACTLHTHTKLSQSNDHFVRTNAPVCEWVRASIYCVTKYSLVRIE